MQKVHQLGLHTDYWSTRMKTAEKSGRDEEIYQNIYTAIVEHYIAPGTKLPEDTLADTFDVSRTIIRKVLLSLSHEGLVSIAPKRGARVARPTQQEGKQVFEARRIVEIAAVPHIVDAISARDIKSLRKLVAEQKRAQEAKDYRAVIRLSGFFHEALISITGNRFLIEYLRNLISRSSLILAVFGSTRGHQHSCQDHDELLDLLERGDARLCRNWMKQHLIDVESTIDFSSDDTPVPDLKQVFSEIKSRRS